MNSAVLQTKGLAIGYQAKKKMFGFRSGAGQCRRVVAEKLDLELYPGELVCLLGPNGCGKSTLMRTLAGVQRPLAGRVLLAGSRLDRISAKEAAKKLSLVLTDRVVTGNLSVYSLVALGRYPYTGWTGRLSIDDEKVVRHAIETTGTRVFAHRHVGDLSDGERQKVMIARAIAQDTPVILLDEPTAHLDLPNRLEIIHLLKRLAREAKKAIVLSTHELDLALQAADRIWLMHAPASLHSKLPEPGLIVDIPESLVLQGDLERAFRRNGFEFDRLSGSFRLRHDGRMTIGLVGEGVAAYWTRRALERIGCKVVPGLVAGRHVVVLEESIGTTWRYVGDHGEVSGDMQSLAELLRMVCLPSRTTRRS